MNAVNLMNPFPLIYSVDRDEDPTASMDSPPPTTAAETKELVSAEEGVELPPPVVVEMSEEILRLRAVSVTNGYDKMDREQLKNLRYSDRDCLDLTAEQEVAIRLELYEKTAFEYYLDGFLRRFYQEITEIMLPNLTYYPDDYFFNIFLAIGPGLNSAIRNGLRWTDFYDEYRGGIREYAKDEMAALLQKMREKFLNKIKGKPLPEEERAAMIERTIEDCRYGKLSLRELRYILRYKEISVVAPLTAIRILAIEELISKRKSDPIEFVSWNSEAFLYAKYIGCKYSSLHESWTSGSLISPTPEWGCRELNILKKLMRVTAQKFGPADSNREIPNDEEIHQIAEKYKTLD